MRLRVVVAYTALLIVALVAAVLTTRQLLIGRIDKLIVASHDHHVEEFEALAASIDPVTQQRRADDPEALFESFFTNHVPAQDQAFYTFVGDEPFLYSFDAPTALLADAALVEQWTSPSDGVRGTTGTDEGEILYTGVPAVGSDGRPTGTFVVVNYLATGRDEVRAELRTIALVGSVLVLVAAALAMSFSRRILRPVRDLTTAAMSVEESDLSARVPEAGNDEMGTLSRSFNDMLDRLEDSFRWQQVFLDDVAHELRTPITIVRGHLGLVRVDDDQHWRVELMNDELARMARSVEELLIVSKAARPDFLRLSVVDVHDLLHDVLAKAEALAPRQWRIGACPAPGGLLVHADADRLEQALLALATNAAEHTPSGAPITVSATRVDQSVLLSVADTGSGVDPAVRDRLFTRFSRAAASESGRPTGMGLGLAIVSSIATAHHGRVEVDSEPGRGATFTVVLPYRDLSKS